MIPAIVKYQKAQFVVSLQYMAQIIMITAVDWGGRHESSEG